MTRRNENNEEAIRSKTQISVLGRRRHNEGYVVKIQNEGKA